MSAEKEQSPAVRVSVSSNHSRPSSEEQRSPRVSKITDSSDGQNSLNAPYGSTKSPTGSSSPNQTSPNGHRLSRNSKESSSSLASVASCETSEAPCVQRFRSCTSNGRLVADGPSADRSKSVQLISRALFRQSHREEEVQQRRGSRRGVNPGRNSRCRLYEEPMHVMYAQLISQQRWFRGTMGVSLVIALFGTALAQICDLPDDPWNILIDMTMVIATLCFIVDLVVQCMADPQKYPCSFFFWMEVAGTGSMLFEISFLLGSAGKINTPSSNVDALVMRAARTAKLGARAGRLVKLLKCLTFIFGKEETHWGSGTRNAARTDEASVLGSRLTHYLSTKAAMLTIFFLVAHPLLQIGTYPEDDLSLRGWGQRLEHDYQLEIILKSSLLKNSTVFKDTNTFGQSVLEMVTFYSQVDYFPYKLEGYPVEVVLNGQQVLLPGVTQVMSAEPNRKQNILKQDVTNCGLKRPGCDDSVKAAIYFNFTKPHQLAAALDALTIVVMVGAMFGMSFALMATVDAMVLAPLERILLRLRESALAIVNKAVKGRKSQDFDGFLQDDHGGGEIDMLETVFKKLQTIIDIHTQTDIVDDAQMGSLDDASKGVILDLMQGRNTRNTLGSCTVRDLGFMSNADEAAAGPVTAVVEVLPVDEAAINSWNLHLLDLRREDQGKVVTHIFFDSHFGQRTGRKYVPESTFRAFHEAVMGEYNDSPYHNYAHACDITYAVYRLMEEARSSQWLAGYQEFPMIIAALAHDLGHGGLTNVFLVETRHELALRYNDQSPLENMHCASLFKICTEDRCNVFQNLSVEEYQHARRICISTILHTDNCHHFEMVKTLRGIFELQSYTCSKQAGGWNSVVSGAPLDSAYIEDVLQANTPTWLELMLHLADVSNPLRPFRVCQAWAWLVLDEFFDQGDQEKSLGLPVGMLNDRDKINRPHSQHGFIKFLVAPFAFASVRLFPAWHPLTSHMARNLNQWRDMWLEAADPPHDDIDACDKDIAKITDEAEELADKVNVLPS